MRASNDLNQTGQGFPPQTPLGQKSHINKPRPPVNEQLNIQYLQRNFRGIRQFVEGGYYTLQDHPLCADGTLPLSAERPKTVSIEIISVGTSARAYLYRPTHLIRLPFI